MGCDRHARTLHSSFYVFWIIICSHLESFYCPVRYFALISFSSSSSLHVAVSSSEVRGPHGSDYKCVSWLCGRLCTCARGDVGCEGKYWLSPWRRGSGGDDDALPRGSWTQREVTCGERVWRFIIAVGSSGSARERGVCCNLGTIIPFPVLNFFSVQMCVLNIHIIDVYIFLNFVLYVKFYSVFTYLFYSRTFLYYL